MGRYCILLLFVFATCFVMASEREEKIKQYIDSELKYHPEARLIDLYKNYFQDAYGPGHLIQDATRAGAYLDWELQQPCWTDQLLWQALGTNHDYYRVNLLLLKNGTIPRDTLLAGMIKSAGLARKPDLESWKKEWNEVLQLIRQVRPDLPNLKSDERLIARAFSEGNVVMHHSKKYEATYCPHYRIIHRSVFERWQKQYLK